MGKVYNHIVTNASRVHDICLPIIPLSMIRYQAMFDFLSEEPSVLRVKKKKNSRTNCMEQIFRIRRWGNNTESVSFSIYALEREWYDYVKESKAFHCGIVIREVVWDMRADMNKVKNCSEKNKLLQAWPHIDSKNYWLNKYDCIKIAPMIIELDEIIHNGILLNERKDTSEAWTNIEIRRLYDWGSIHNIWSPQKENIEVEKRIVKIKNKVNQITKDLSYSIYSIDLDYSIEPNLYKKIITGV